MASVPYQAVIAEGDGTGLIDLRAAPAALPRIREATSATLSSRVGHTERIGPLEVLTLGPDHWLLRVPENSAQNQHHIIEQAIGSAFGMSTLVSDAYVAFTIHGNEARDVLAQGCPLDLDATAFPIGTCARSILAGAPVLLIRDPMGFDLLVDRTLAKYLRQWLQTAAGTPVSQID